MGSELVAEIETILIPKIKEAWNQHIETTGLRIARDRCPAAPMFRESYTPGTGMRKYPQRLKDTIYIKYNDGVGVLASDDERMDWLEKGTRPHAINADADMRGRSRRMTGTPGGDAFYDRSAGLMWRTEAGQLVSGRYGVLHPGIDPEPVLFPALVETASEFVPILTEIVREYQAGIR